MNFTINYDKNEKKKQNKKKKKTAYIEKECAMKGEANG
jgi:hypothetical protein